MADLRELIPDPSAPQGKALAAIAVLYFRGDEITLDTIEAEARRQREYAERCDAHSRRTVAEARGRRAREDAERVIEAGPVEPIDDEREVPVLGPGQYRLDEPSPRGEAMRDELRRAQGRIVW